MELPKLLILCMTIMFGFVHYVYTDGQRDHGEACSLRSQIFNVFRENDSPEGCMSSKGLVCLNHKCVCADPSNVYEDVPPESSILSIPSASDIGSKASNFLKNLVKGTTTTTTTPASTQSSSGMNGKCVGRAGSPCFTQNSTCVKHATCEGSAPKMCKCQGIYSSNTAGYCSKSASFVQQAVKHTIG